jgi:hypothetical protein
MSVPIISDDKKTEALIYARSVRKKRSDIKKGLKSKVMSFNELLDDKNEYHKVFMDMKMMDILMSLPNYGTIRAKKTLEELQISNRKKLKGLGDKQMVRVIDYFKKLQFSS